MKHFRLVEHIPPLLLAEQVPPLLLANLVEHIPLLTKLAKIDTFQCKCFFELFNFCLKMNPIMLKYQFMDKKYTFQWVVE